MAKAAVARATVFALRRQIARIEGTLPERLEDPLAAAGAGRRQGGGVLATGADGLDAALGGGLPKAALIEVHGAGTRDAGAVTGFGLALAALLASGSAAAPVLWIGMAELFHEAGFPDAAGLWKAFGIEPLDLLLCTATRAADVLWIAEEAARLATPAAVVLEMRGNPRQFDLTATRRLHTRARDSGRPLLLLRQAAVAAPTAAPVRLVVGPSPSALRGTMARPLAGSIDRPAFTVAVDKGGRAGPRQFTLEWNPDERRFEEQRRDERAKNPLPVVSLPRHGADIAAAPGKVLAFERGRRSGAAGDQPPRQEQPFDRGPRRAG